MRLIVKSILWIAICTWAIYLPVQAQTFEPALFKNLKIRSIGPANMSGRITAIDAVVSNPKTIYIGAASGGVWKSENGGSAWRPVFDAQPTQNIGSIAIQQDNSSVVWVGTGEGNPRNSVNLGMGVFKSLDAGVTWQRVGLENTRSIHRLLIDPRNPSVVYAGAMGDPFVATKERGVYKTTDGGSTWKQILFTNELSGVADMAMDPANPNKIFAAMYEHHRTPHSFTSGGPGSGLYLTFDAGITWKKLGTENGLPAGDLGRIGIAIARSNPNRVYAKIEAARNAIYRSEDGGLTWTMVNDQPAYANNRPFYFQELAVDTKDENRLYNIYQPLTVSEDGGKTFQPEPMIPADETKGIHADFHAFWMDPNDPAFFIIGGDGGIGITHDKGKSWYFPESIPVGQFYHINADNDLPYNVYGGLQDNGNWSGPAYVWKRGGIRTLYWQYLVGGDGFYISPDSADSRFGYGTSQNGYLYRYDKLTGYYQSIRPPAPDLKTRLRFNWNAGFAQDPTNSNVAYYGSQFLHKTTDKGATWQIISPDLTTNNPAHQRQDYGGLTIDQSGAEFYNTILSIAPSKLNPQLIWVGTDDGNVQLSRNGGTTWTNVTANIKGLPKESWIAQLQASRHREGEVWLVANNYRKGDYAPYVFRTQDFGKTWQRVVDGAKVKGYALCVMQDPVQPRLVFVGTENGLWISLDEGQTFAQVVNGFPSVSTMDLVIQEREANLVIGTFGRSIWILDDLQPLRQAAAGFTKPLTALPTREAVQVKGIFIAPPGNIWTGFHTTFEGENRPFGVAMVPFFVKQPLPGDPTTAMARVYDSQNTLIRTLTVEGVTEGLNYVRWPLDMETARLGSYEDDEYKGIPVLPGTYRVRIDYRGANDETEVKVIPDPRFPHSQAIEEANLALRLKLNGTVAALEEGLKEVRNCQTTLDKVIQQLDQANQSTGELRTLSGQMKEKLKTLTDAAVGSRPNRQIGAWSGFEVTARSKVNDALSATRARNNGPSAQDMQLVLDAEQLTNAWLEQVRQFKTTDWKRYREQVEAARLTWFKD